MADSWYAQNGALLRLISTMTSLRHLRFHAQNLSAVAKALWMTTRLQSLTMIDNEETGADLLYPGFQELTHVMRAGLLSNLKELHLYSTCVSAPASIFYQLKTQCPELESLSFRAATHAAFNAMCFHHQRNLRTLHVGGGGPVRRFLCPQHKLQHLRLDDVDDDTLETLCLVINGGRHLSHLESLDISTEIDDDGDFDNVDFVDMFAALHQLTAIRSVRFAYGQLSDARHIEDIFQKLENIELYHISMEPDVHEFMTRTAGRYFPTPPSFAESDPNLLVEVIHAGGFPQTRCLTLDMENATLEVFARLPPVKQLVMRNLQENFLVLAVTLTAGKFERVVLSDFQLTCELEGGDLTLRFYTSHVSRAIEILQYVKPERLRLYFDWPLGRVEWETLVQAMKDVSWEVMKNSSLQQ